jgi:sugar transferase (PEP-CTERM system associated)
MPFSEGNLHSIIQPVWDLAAASGLGLSVAYADAAWASRKWTAVRRVFVITDGDARAFLDRIATAKDRDIQVAGVMTLRDDGRDSDLNAQLSPEELRRHGISEIVVAASDAKGLPRELLLQCRIRGIPVLSETAFWEREAGRIIVDRPDLGWFLSDRGFRHSRGAALRKRLFDLVVATALLILTLPLMLIIALLVRRDSPGPALYRQERVGLGGRIFTMVKFRSMRMDAEAAGEPRWAEQDDARITRIGKWIRYTRIDELPQLFNVLRGEMSLIGPRPERPYFVNQLNEVVPLYSTRHWVKPGMSGWAQVKGSYGASVDDAREKLEYDLYYVKHRSLAFDMLILLRTLRVVLLREGAR